VFKQLKLAGQIFRWKTGQPGIFTMTTGTELMNFFTQIQIDFRFFGVSCAGEYKK